MKIIIIGAYGAIGNALSSKLIKTGAEILRVGSPHGEARVDITDKHSIKTLLANNQPFDGVICAAGTAYAGTLAEMDDVALYKGFESKLMGQVNLVLIAQRYVADNGFITLTSGVLSEEPKTGCAGLGLVNAALNGFVVNAALEMPRNIRLNIVSPSVIVESIEKYGSSPGRQPVLMKDVVQAYTGIIESGLTGNIIKVYGNLI